MSEEEKQKGFRSKIMKFLPEGFIKTTARREIGYEERQKKTIAEATGENGTDAGEAGKSWDDTFPKKNE